MLLGQDVMLSVDGLPVGRHLPGSLQLRCRLPHESAVRGTQKRRLPQPEQIPAVELCPSALACTMHWWVSNGFLVQQ